MTIHSKIKLGTTFVPGGAEVYTVKIVDRYTIYNLSDDIVQQQWVGEFESCGEKIRKAYYDLEIIELAKEYKL